MTARPLDELLRELGDADGEVRREAAYLIGERRDRRATLALVEAVRAASARRDVALVAVGALALGKLRDGRALELLVELARTATVAEPIHALGRLGRAEAAPVVRAALETPRLRRAAILALGRLGEPGLVQGRVAWWNAERGFGAVTPRGADRKAKLFFHRRDWDADGAPARGLAVTFYEIPDARRPTAVRVRPAPEKAPPPEPEGPGVEAAGKVRWFDAQKGYGFIRIDGSKDDALAHARDILVEGDAPRALRSKQRVTFVAVKAGDKIRATRIRVEPGLPG